jgi:teichuronic acid exporter
LSSQIVQKKRIISSLIWKILERGGVQGIQFILTLILARLLSPNEYGIIALITIFIALATVFIQNGFNTALIQKKNADNLDFSSVFYLSLFVAALLYILLFFCAPLIARFYNNGILTPVIRILSVTLFFGAVIVFKWRWFLAQCNLNGFSSVVWGGW